MTYFIESHELIFEKYSEHYMAYIKHRIQDL